MFKKQPFIFTVIILYNGIIYNLIDCVNISKRSVFYCVLLLSYFLIPKILLFVFLLLLFSLFFILVSSKISSGHKTHYCYYCGLLVFKLPRHLENNHGQQQGYFLQTWPEHCRYQRRQRKDEMRG